MNISFSVDVAVMMTLFVCLGGLFAFVLVPFHLR